MMQRCLSKKENTTTMNRQHSFCSGIFWWTNGELNTDNCDASATCYHYHHSPIADFTYLACKQKFEEKIFLVMKKNFFENFFLKNFFREFFFAKIFREKFLAKNFLSPHQQKFFVGAKDPSGKDGINLLRNQWINDVWHDRDDLKTDW